MGSDCEDVRPWVINGSEDDVWWGSDEFSDREEAIKAGRAEYGSDSFWIGRKVKVELSGEGFGDQIVEQLGEILYDEVGEVSENWRPSDNEVAELDIALAMVIGEWLKKNPVRCWKVEEAEEVPDKPKGD